MKHYVGLDVSLKETSVCVLDEEGSVVTEAKVLSEPEVLVGYLRGLSLRFERIGLEAGPLSQWLHDGLAVGGFCATCIETRHAKAFLAAQQVNKTDRKDARGIAQMMRVNLYKAVHVKTVASQENRALLTSRRFLGRRLLDLENEIRGLLRGFGLKVGAVKRRRFAARAEELLGNHAALDKVIRALLPVHAVALAQFDKLDTELRKVAREDPVCRLLMTVPSVGVVTALTFRATVDQPGRFSRSKALGAHFGMTPRRNQSGELDRNGRISKCGDEMLRSMLFEAANVMLTRDKRWSWLKAWALQVAKRSGMRKAKVALARRLAVIMHRMWVDSTPFCWTRKERAA